MTRTSFLFLLAVCFCMSLRLYPGAWAQTDDSNVTQPIRIESILKGRSQSIVHEARLCARLCGIGVLLRVGLFRSGNLDGSQGVGEPGAQSMK
jgi:hypothetical protein